MSHDERLLALRQRLGPRLPTIALAVLLAVVAAAAIGMHRPGMGWGDDWTLYLRQAESLYEGHVGEVIADNHFNVDNAAKPGFSPYVYPWGFPIVMAPFLRFFGQDWDLLRLVGVASLCLFLLFFHRLVRRRMDAWPAVGVVAAVGTTMAYLEHTGHLLSELPFMASVAGCLWYLDRLRHDAKRAPRPLHLASRRQLVTLALAAVWAFNIRREGLAVLGAIAVALAADVWPAERPIATLARQWRTLPWRLLATPFVAWLAGAALFQFLLPSAIAPEYEDAGLHQVWKKLGGPYRTAFAEQLGFPDLRGTALLVVFLVVVAGVGVRLWRAASADLPLLVVAVGTLTMAGSIHAVSPRYLMTATPFAVYFGAQALAALPLPRRAGPWVAVAVLTLATAHHLTKVPSQVAYAADLRDMGAVLDGPDAPYAQAAFTAVRTYTHEDDVVAFFKARALTYFTGRRAVQSSELDVVQQRADYSMMRKDSTFSQSLVTDSEAAAMGWVKVWEDDEWVLWRLPLYESG